MPKKLHKLALGLLTAILLFSTQDLNSQVVINEYSGANYNSFAVSFGGYEDWIELYNSGNTTVDLSGYHLSDRLDNPTKWQIPDGISISPNDHLRVWASGRDGLIGTQLHADFKITQTSGKEAIVFADPAGVILDSDSLNIPNKEGHSWGRMTDGAAEWGVFTNPTPNGANSNGNQPYVDKPRLSPKSGFFTGSVEVSIENMLPNVSYHYTTNGTTPTASSTKFTGPVNLTNTTVFSVIAIPDDAQILSSFIDYHTYFVDEEHSIPVVSISGNGLMNLLNGNQTEPRGNFEMFDEEGDRVAEATGEFNKHGNDSWAYPQRGIDWITRDEFGDDHSIKYKVFPSYTKRDRFQRLILKAAANDNYPNEFGSAHIRDAYVHALSQRANLEMDERTYEPCILYVNGEYWGVYELREKVDDHDYTKYYYDQGRNDIDFLKTWGGTWEEYGSQQDWDILVNYVLTHDMTNPTDYGWVEDRLEVLSLIDYMILHSLNVSSDWLNWNTAWWRGRDPDGGAQKWRYILWDEDATFGHYINYTGVPSTSALADPCNPEVLGNPGGQGHIPILKKLLENEDFFALYINRYADLNNDFFNCDYMIPFLDSLIGRIEPEMPRHVAKWGGNVDDWKGNVQNLREFILERCEIIDQSLFDCYEDEGLSGPYELVVDVFPEETGRVKINTSIGQAYPWSATYFGGIGINLQALPNPGWGFTHWTVANNTFSPDQFSEAIAMSLEDNDTIVAHYTDLCAGVVVTPEIFGGGSICNGQELLLTASAGYMDYEWSEGSDDESIEISSPGIYSVTVTTDDYCKGEATIVIGETTGPEPDIAGPETLCAGNTIELDAGAFNNYAWSTSENTQMVSISEGGIYQVTVTDGAGCTGVDEIIVQENDFITPEIIGAESICTGSSTTLSVGNYESYVWSTSVSSAEIIVTQAGTYTVTVTDAAGCVGEDEITVSVDEALQPTIEGEAVFCANGSTMIEVEQLFDNYEWSTSESGASIEVSESGIFSVTVSDATGCTGTTSINVTEITELQPNITGDLSFCAGSSTVLNAGNFDNYSWSTSDNTTSIEVSEPGFYSVTVTDNNGCSGENQVAVQENVLPLANIAGEDNFCAGGSTSLSALGTFESYAWSTTAQVPAINVNSAGIYGLTVTDAEGCSNSTSISVIENPLPIPVITGPNSVCPGNSIFLNAPAGYASYSWTGGGTNPFINISQPGMIELNVVDVNGCEGEAMVNIITGVPAETEESITLCNGGSYNGNAYFSSTMEQFIEQGANGCDSTHSVNIEVLAEVNLNLVNESDCNAALATVVASATGGTNSFNYLWSNGNAGYLQENLSPGIYFVTATDAMNCSAISSIEITEQNGLSIDPEIENVSCFGANDGAIDLNILSGTQPYTISWSNGNTTANLENLEPGEYTLLLQDANGCSIFTSVTVGEPAPIQVNVSTTGAGNDNSGTALAVVQGGAAPYQYQWSTGSNGFSIDELSAGAYEVTVTDANGCTTTTSFQISTSTAVNELESLVELSLYPNPSDGQFIIDIKAQELPVHELTIFNILGERVFVRNSITGNTMQIPVDLTGKGSRTYFVLIKIGDGELLRQVVVTE